MKRPADPLSEAGSPERAARRIAFYRYVPLAIAWILGTDALLAFLDGGVWSSMVKGAGFVLVTGTLLYLMIRRELSRREALDRERRTLTENVPDLVFRMRVRPELRFEYVSPSSVTIGGYTPSEYYEDAGRIMASVHEDHHEELMDLLTDIDSEDREAELRWRHKDGHAFWGEIRVTKERDTDGQVTWITGVLRDVTARHELDRRRALLTSVLEAAGEAVLVTDRSGSIEYVNRAFTEITGYAPDDVLGRTPEILESGEMDPSFNDDLWKTLRAGRTFRGVFLNRRADGRLYEQATSITPLRGASGEIEHYVSVGRDITVQRALERRLRFTEKMDAVGQLAAGVAHDFRNLLNVIVVNAEFLREADLASSKGTGGEGGEEIAEILGAARHGTDLVGRLLQVARQPEVETRATDLAALVADMKGTLRAVVGDAVAVDVQVPNQAQPAAVDPDLIRDALLNLVTNASQAMPGGGRILVQLEPQVAGGPGESDMLRLVVRDEGVGMSEETMGRIFDPFFTTKETGTGLGLPMVKGIVERHGGTLDVRSVVGEGTTVTILLRAVAREAEPRPTSPDRPTSETAGEMGEHILLAEDDHRLRALAERALRRLGYEVTATRDGAEALSRIEASPDHWDLVIADLVMPGSGGLELYERTRQRGWSIPFLFTSGHGPSAMSEAGVGGARHTFLEKPWTLETLRLRVRDAIDGNRASA